MKYITLIIASVALLSSACQPPAAGGNTAELEKRIKKLEGQVASLAKAGGRAKRPQPKPQTAAYKLSVGNSPVLGLKTAKINLMMWSDYQCPYCSRVDPIIQEILKDPELKSKVNVVFKNFPLGFHKNAMPAAKAALAAGDQGKYWEMSAMLFKNQKDLTAENFKKFAGEIGLDVKKFESDLKANDAKYAKQIKDDMDMGKNFAKVRGTPSLFVGGWVLKNRSVAGVKELIKEHKLDS